MVGACFPELPIHKYALPRATYSYTINISNGFSAERQQKPIMKQIIYYYWTTSL